MYSFALLLTLFSLRLVDAHIAFWHPSMYGFNVTDKTFSYDNRPVVPLAHMSFSQWWFHGHLDYPPHKEDVFELPAGQKVTSQLACNKGATTFYASSEGGNIQDPNNPNTPCPSSPTSEFHTTGLSDVKGCALAIAYKSDASQVQPEDFTVFSVNQTCVWNRYTDFSVPDKMPPCPNNMCTCAFFWIHSPDSGSEQNYMNGFQCSVTGSTSSVGLATSKVARRCGADPENGVPNAVPGNCTYGAKQPLYWYQAERNNMFEGTYAPPFYNDLYNFQDGPQSDIFQDSYSSIPTPAPDQMALPVLATPGANGASPAAGSGGTTPTPTSTVSANVTSASATPSSGTGSQCSSKRSVSSFARRHAPVERGLSSFTHRAAGMTRRSRKINPEKRLDLWKPF